MTPETRPITSAGWAMLHRMADGDTDGLARLLMYFRDPADEAGERWEFLRAAEANVWRAVELLLLRKMIQRRFQDGELNAWTQTTPLAVQRGSTAHIYAAASCGTWRPVHCAAGGIG